MAIQPSAGMAGLDALSLSVLVIDGDDESRAETAAALLGVGVGADDYGDAEQAMEMIRLNHARRQDYNLILVDCAMPGKDGAELIHEIRALLKDTATVIILTIAGGGTIPTGADAFMAKPIDGDAVLREYHNVLARRQPEETQSEAILDGRRILVAEDMSVNAEIVKQLLSMNFMEVDHAENGKEAVEMFQKSEEGHYDAILMDVRMPVMDGLAATEAIRASARSDAKTVPIIAMTSNYFDEDVQRSLKAGMDAHLEKPVEPEQIYRTLAELIRKRVKGA